MASLNNRTGYYAITFRYDGEKYNRSLKTKDEDEAENTKKIVESTLYKIQNGDLAVPDHVDFVTFVISGGKTPTQAKPPKGLTLKKLTDEYKEAIDGSLEDTTLYTIGIHTSHLLRLLGRRFNPRELDQENLQTYISARQKEKTNKRTNVTPSTVRKEVATLSAIWSWAPESYRLPPFPSKAKLRYRKSAEKPPFQTWEEIEQQIKRGGLTEKQIGALWDCLFLSLDQIAELLVFVDKKAAHPFLYPMVVMAAHTGSRRSEILRSKITDLQDDTVVVHERKRRKGKHSTRRVPLSTLMQNVMKEWLANHPGGQYTFCMGNITRSKIHRSQPEPITGDQAQDHLKRTLAGSKWEVLRGWHVLRHSFISNCALKGIDQRIIDSFVGHTTEEMRKRYTHLFPSAKKDAIKSVFG